MDRYTKTTSTSWFGRIGNSIGGMFFGLLMFFGSIVLLWWNEGRAVRTAKGLDEGSENVVVLSNPELNSSNNGKLIHFHGEMTTNDVIIDDEFNLEVNALKFKREVEMFQWKENTKTTKKKKLGGGEEETTEYTYTKEWSSELISSSGFEIKSGHLNPSDFPYDSYIDYPSSVLLGEFYMTDAILGRLDEFEPIKLNNDNLINTKGFITKDNDNGSPVDKIFIGDGSKSNPNIGDVRIAFYQVPAQEYSIIAKQESEGLVPYITETETSILLVSPGNLSAKQMFEDAQSANTATTWIFRVVGFFVMFFGLMAMTRIVSVIADFIPILGTIVSLGLGVFAGVVSFLISTVTIGLAWIYYRPILGAILILTGLGIALFFYKKSLNKKSI
ncbi:MAG: TMEM43 family protein [Flavobacteriales bacterium]|nr:TMEM43 family protein [Flavobacteriales bacterium]